ncbi:hypothetical protein F0562_027581 [Nyssa sinensis]|uniref:Transmembrane protein n=1 Tax=Nyssa sinensis TaxID=561372 RepID=A0A5J5B563_9ASTE|nr:hypothetical protein F0562_027581 [Nyssa sinensis]
MEWWHIMTLPMQRVWIFVAKRLGIRKTGLVKLRHDVKSCEYKDVHVLWEMLERNESGSSGRIRKRHIWNVFGVLKRKFVLGLGIGIMKAFGFWVLLSVVGTALVFLSFSSKGSSTSVSDMALTRHGNGMTITATSRKLKEDGHTSSKTDAGNVNLEDYHPIDPVPSSKAYIKPGPIQHGTPLMPYIPKPSPPGHPNHGGFP